MSFMIKFIKKPIGIISIIVILGLAVGGYFYFGGEEKSKFDVVIAKRSELIQEVSVTGRVKPARSVELAFEKGGKVAAVYADVGKQMSSGQTLVTLESAELTAELSRTRANVESAKSSLKQYEAALESEQAKFDEMKKGTRPEEIQIAQVKVDNAKKTLADAQVNLDNVKRKAEDDLMNLYDDVPDIIQDAFVKADDALHKQIDEIFDNDDSSNPQLTFLSTNSQAEIDTEWQRLIITSKFNDLKTIVSALPADQVGRLTAMQDTKGKLAVIRDFLGRVLDAVNFAAGVSQSAINTYKTNINTARNNINGEISDITVQEQAIAAQKITNENNITAAKAKVNDAENTLAAAGADLSLKQSGSTSEQLAAQVSRVKQAEANVAGQRSQIKQAEAQVQNIQAQIAKAIMRAPISGTVTKQDAKVGEIVSANTPLVSLISASQFEIEANMPEADIAKVKLGNTAKVTLDAYGNDVNFNVKVVAIDPAETIVDGVATYKTTFQFTDKDERIKSGMTANIDISTEKREGVIVIPQRAVVTQNGDKIVRILNSETPKEVKVKTGLRGSDGNIEIIEGVNEGDKVIIFFE